MLILILLSCLIIILCTILYNTISTDSTIRQPNKIYIQLVHESYDSVPNLNIMLFHLNMLYKINYIDEFYIIDSIRLLSKSFRNQKFCNKLTKVDGNITAFYDQMYIYRNEIIKNNKLFRINNICEIGFQVGAGSLTFLTSLKHKLKYYGFDYGLNHSKYSYEIISNFFDMNMTWGKSEYTVPSFKLVLCNVIHIDGDHNPTSIYNDIINMKRFANRESMLFLDDVYYKHKSIIKARRNNIINSIRCFNWKPFCICRYNI